MLHWANKYVGLPWVSGGRGPSVFDCWGLLHWVYREEFAIELPSFVGIDAEDHLEVRRRMLSAEHGSSDLFPDWDQIDKPEDGCAVALGRFEFFHHVGIYMVLPEGGRVLHCKKPLGVLHQPLSQLRADGFSRIAFYKHRHGLHHRVPESV